MVRLVGSHPKGPEFKSQQEQWENFLLHTFCTDYYFGISSTPVLLLQKHIKDPSHSAKNAGGRLQLNTDMHSNFQALVDIKKCSIKRKS